MNFTKQSEIISAVVSAALITSLAFAAFFVVEPAVVIGQVDSDEFTVTQEIAQEIAFTAQPNNVPMDETLSGLTGGTSNGTSTFTVATNNPDGYTVRIRFDNSDAGATAGTAMRYNPDRSNFAISNAPSTAVFSFVPPAADEPAQFGYTASGPRASQTFRSSGSDCDQSGGTATGVNCFKMNSTIATDEPVFTSTTPTSGDINNVHFRVVVGIDPNPVLPTGTYTATATLSAIVNI